MELKEVQVNLYRNIVDSKNISIEPDVTCLVGKNESGKTAILQALYSLNPAFPDLVKVDIVQDYPRWRKVADQKKVDLGAVFPITATFALEESDIQTISENLPFPVPQGTHIKAKRDYSGGLEFELDIDEDEWIEELITSSRIDENFKDEASECESLLELANFFNEKYQEQPDKRKKAAKELNRLASEVRKISQFSSSVPSYAVEVIERLIPKFFYFDEYSSLPGRLDLNELLDKQKQNLSEAETTALSFLKMAGVQGKEFMEEEFEIRIAELEAAANEISRQVFEYWTQNRELIVELHGDAKTVSAPNGKTVVHQYVDIRLNDLRHQMTTNFETRSTGFQWFFSFIAAFSEFDDKSLIILLDEPGLGLHARAQRDLLRFIDERLAENNQVIYTTHSPFMLNPAELERARLVEDLTTRENPDRGAQVSTDVLSVQGDTLFPLQAALGYDLAQNLFVGGHNLIVEGPSDMIFLLIISEYLETEGRESLNDKFTIVPVGGIDKVPTFIALLGTQLDLTVLIDATNAPNQRIREMINRGLLSPQSLISVDIVTKKSPSDIEDLFQESEYLELYNGAFDSNITPSDLQGDDSIVRKLERYQGEKFKHLKPATYFLRNKETTLQNLSDETLDNFEELFSNINSAIE